MLMNPAWFSPSNSFQCSRKLQYINNQLYWRQKIQVLWAKCRGTEGSTTHSEGERDRKWRFSGNWESEGNGDDGRRQTRAQSGLRSQNTRHREKMALGMCHGGGMVESKVAKSEKAPVGKIFSTSLVRRIVRSTAEPARYCKAIY